MSRKTTGYLYKRNGTWTLEYTFNGQRFRQALRSKDGQRIRTRDEAEEARDRILAPFALKDETAILESLSGRIVGRKAELARLDEEQHPPMPISDAWKAYCQSPSRPDSGPATMTQYAYHWRLFARWSEAERIATLRDVTPELASRFAGTIVQRNLSANRFNKIIGFLRLMWRVIGDEAKAPANPWLKVANKRAIPVSRRELTVEELTRVCAKATGEMRILFALGLYTGLRLGDCATLRWSEVDLTRRQIRRIPNKTARRNPRPVIVPMHATLLAMLGELGGKRRGEYVLPATASVYQRNPSTLSHQINCLFESSGVTTHAPGTGIVKTSADDGTIQKVNTGKRAVVEVGFHSLRHTFVSLCREANAPLAVVEAIVGHSNPAMTRHYTHIGDEAAGAAVNLLPAIEGAQPADESVRGEALATVKKLARKLTLENTAQVMPELLTALDIVAARRQTLTAG